MKYFKENIDNNKANEEDDNIEAQVRRMAAACKLRL